MIDLHCHILPGVDDGARDLDDSIAMARIAAADGVRQICATPHIRHDHGVRIEELPDRLGRLDAELRRASIPVEVVAGGEVAETAIDGLDDAELRRLTLGGSGTWLLVEPAPGALSDSLERAVAELDARGFHSLIAHPERHPGANLTQRLARLVRAGALVQATAAALLAPKTEPAILDLAARGLVHVLGSDSHSATHGRTPELSRAFARLGQFSPMSRHIGWIAHDAPAAILRGELLEPPFEPERP